MKERQVGCLPLDHEMTIRRRGIANTSCTSATGMAATVCAGRGKIGIGNRGWGGIEDAVIVVRYWGRRVEILQSIKPRRR